MFWCAMHDASASKTRRLERLWPLLLLPLIALGYWAVGSRFDGPTAPLARDLGRMPDFALPRIMPNGTLTPKLVGNAAYAGKPYVLAFWASWCLACQDEAPDLARLAARLKDAGVPLLVISTNDTVADAVRTGAAALDRPPLLSDADGAFSSRLKMDTLPQTIVVDAQGAIRYRYEQRLSADAAARVWQIATAESSALKVATKR
jgi:peroxiredoxin